MFERNKFILSFLLFFLCSLQLEAQYEVSAVSFGKISVNNETEVNTENLEFSPFFLRDLIGFVYSNPKSKKDNNISEYYFDLAFSAHGMNENLIKRASFGQNINSEFHEGPACFDDKKGVLYFTRTYYDIKKGTSRDTIVRKIYQATERSDYSDAKPIALSNDRYSICHPTLSSSGKKMIFSSNMNSTDGNMDLYSSTMKEDWNSPINLSILNSESNDVFPFLMKDSIIFFASDRPGGKGGLDIYYSTYKDSSWDNPLPLPYPFNTEYDDFGIIIDKNGKFGYFTSSRPGGKGKDDLYSFSTKDKLWERKINIPSKDVSFVVLDKLTLQPISGVKVLISDISLKNDKYNLEDFDVDVLAGEKAGELLMKLSPKSNSLVDSLISNKEGIVSRNLKIDKRYIVRTYSEKYENEYTVYDPMKDDNTVNIILNPIPPKLVAPPVVKKQEIYIPIKKNEVVVFNNIYYELNSARILQGAALELDALAKIMNQRITMTVELSAHTDSRGKSEYNQTLSIQRATSAKQYLVDKGISELRVKAIGYGESRIRNHCTDGKTCTDEEHKYNRRTEVRVLTE